MCVAYDIPEFERLKVAATNAKRPYRNMFRVCHITCSTVTFVLWFGTALSKLYRFIIDVEHARKPTMLQAIIIKSLNSGGKILENLVWLGSSDDTR